MTVTLSKDGTQVATEGSRYGASVSPSTLMVMTFSDGVKVAITGYDDAEAQDPVFGLPANSGGTEVVNMWLYGINDIMLGGTTAVFDIYDYTSGSLGTQLYHFSNSTDYDGTFQFRYNTTTHTLQILSSSTGHNPATDGTISGFSGSQVYSSAICFLRGTLILTARGEVPVETLREGDLVATRFGGLRPVRWIGTQTMEGRLAAPACHPVRLAKGSLGEGCPSCDLRVSPGHAVLLAGNSGDLLVHAGALVNGSSITQERMRGVIEYYHLDLGEHDCVLANGAWAESYFEDRNRDSFHNAAEFHARFPDHEPVRQGTCLPVIAAGTPAAAALRDAVTPPAAARAA